MSLTTSEQPESEPVLSTQTNALRETPALSEDPALQKPIPVSRQRSVWRGVLWQQWLAHGGTVRGFLSAWLVCTWVLPLLSHPPLLMTFAAAYAAWAGQAFGGSETLDGTEEFTYALPPRRQVLYLSHLAIGMAPLILFAFVGVPIIAFDLPQRLWSLLLESGLTEGYGPAWPVYLYLLAILVPLAVYSFCFVISAISSTRAVASQAWSIGVVTALYVTALTCIIEREIWQQVNGRLACPVLLLLSGLVLLAGYQSYAEKDGITRSTAQGNKGRWLILIVAIVLIGLLGFLLTSAQSIFP